MDLLKQAFSELERTVEKTVTEAASAVVESASQYPKPASESARAVKQLHLSAKAVAQQLQDAERSWDDYYWQEHQAAWRAALQQLQDPNNQQSAADLAQQLQQLFQELLLLPDPVPAISQAAEVASKSAELELNNRSLQQQVAHLQKDQAEVSQLLKDYQEEQAAHAALKVSHAALQEELGSIKSNQQSSSHLQQQVQEQEHTISSLQAALGLLRKEFEASQSSLFELMSQQEAAAGTASTAEQLAVEEIERLTAELQQMRKDKGQLQRELLQYQQQQGSAAMKSEAAIAGDWDGAGDDAAAASAAAHSGSRQHQHDAELARLQAELEAAQEAARDQQHEVALLNTKLAAADSRLQRLTTELEHRPPASAAAAMAEQLVAMSALLTQQLEAEGWGQEGTAAAVAAVAVPGQLEPLLQERCRRLEQSFQSAKAEAAAASASATAAEQRLQQLQQQVEQQQQLVRQLEADLVAMSSSDSRNAPSGSSEALKIPSALDDGPAEAEAAAAEGGSQGRDSLLDAALLQLMSSADNAAAGVNSDATATADTSRSNSEAAADGAAAILAAVAAQRDRFRARLTEVESKAAALKQQCSASQAKVEDLQKDNVALIEKIRFLERYKQQAQATGGSNGSGSAVTVIRVDGAGCIVQEVDRSGYIGGQRPGNQAGAKANRYRCGPLSLNLGGKSGSSSSKGAAVVGGVKLRPRGAIPKREAGCFGDEGDLEDPADVASSDPETRYQGEYEARLNPFAEFQQNESESRLRGMQLHDKALLAANRLIAGSKVARAAVAVYVVLLHVFLMLLMYYSATPHTVLQDAQRGTAISSSTVDAVTAARLAAAGSGVGGVTGTSSQSPMVAAVGLRLLLHTRG